MNERGNDNSQTLLYALDCIVKDGYTTFSEPEYNHYPESVVKVTGYTPKTEHYKVK